MVQTAINIRKNKAILKEDMDAKKIIYVKQKCNYFQNTCKLAVSVQTDKVIIGMLQINKNRRGKI